MPASEVLRWRICDECQECPMRRPRRCTGCRAVSYCSRVDGKGRAACQNEAWAGHKEACKAAQRERKGKESIAAAKKGAAAAAAEAAVVAKTKETARKKAQKKRKAERKRQAAMQATTAAEKRQ